MLLRSSSTLFSNLTLAAASDISGSGTPFRLDYFPGDHHVHIQVTERAEIKFLTIFKGEDYSFCWDVDGLLGHLQVASQRAGVDPPPSPRIKNEFERLLARYFERLLARYEVNRGQVALPAVAGLASGGR